MGAVSISRMGGPPPFIALAKTLTITHTERETCSQKSPNIYIITLRNACG